MENDRASEQTPGVLGRRLRCLGVSSRWILGCASILLLVCASMFVYESLNVLHDAHKLAQIESGITSSIAELRILQAKQAMLGQIILEIAADGQQEIAPAWRSMVIHYRRHGKDFTGSIHDTLARIHLGSEHGLESKSIIGQLGELEELHELMQNDILTVARLTDEGRSDDIAAMHATVNQSGAAVTEQLENLRSISQIALLNSSKQIQRSAHRVFWSGLGTILLGTIISVRWWNSRRRGVKLVVEPNSVNSESDTVEIAAEQALAERFLLRGVHVLVAEDDITCRRLLARVFENAGAVVTIACDGGHALHQFRKANSSGHPVQLVIMDLGMPVMDGVQVAMQLRDVDQFEGPVLALTAANTPDVRAECLEAGFDDFLSKPVDRKRLLQLATDYLGKAVPV